MPRGFWMCSISATCVDRQQITRHMTSQNGKGELVRSYDRREVSRKNSRYSRSNIRVRETRSKTREISRFVKLSQKRENPRNASPRTGGALRVWSGSPKGMTFFYERGTPVRARTAQILTKSVLSLQGHFASKRHPHPLGPP